MCWYIIVSGVLVPALIPCALPLAVMSLEKVGASRPQASLEQMMGMK